MGLGSMGMPDLRLHARTPSHVCDRVCHQFPRRQMLRHLSLVVMSIGAIVYCAELTICGHADAAPGKPATQRPATNETLSRPAAEMRDAILAAVHRGDLDDLKTALELNEMRPDIADEKVDDPVAFWRRVSKDGTGRDILEALGRLLEMKPVAVPLGRDIENNAIYVWPYLAERNLETLTAEESADFAKLATPQEITAMKAARRWLGLWVAIGADGVWHTFRRGK
jgi:hypothetical protein